MISRPLIDRDLQGLRIDAGRERDDLDAVGRGADVDGREAAARQAPDVGRVAALEQRVEVLLQAAQFGEEVPGQIGTNRS